MAAYLSVFPAGIVSANAHFAFVRFDQGGDYLDQRRLATSVLSEQTKNLSLLYLQCHVFQDVSNRRTGTGTARLPLYRKGLEDVPQSEWNHIRAPLVPAILGSANIPEFRKIKGIMRNVLLFKCTGER